MSKCSRCQDTDLQEEVEEELAMFKCFRCQDTNLQEEEVFVYNCYGKIVPHDEASLERNAQNPDYAVLTLCNVCEEMPAVQVALKDMRKTGVFISPPPTKEGIV